MNSDTLLSEEKWVDFNGESPLINIYNSFHDLTDDIKYIINKQTFLVSFKKSKFISSPIHSNRHIYLILNGVARGFIKDDNKEITTWIAKENEMVGDLDIFFDSSAPYEEYVQALEDVHAVAIPYSMSKHLYNHFNIANYIGRKITQLQYAHACERAFITRLHSAERRYLRFIKSYPELIDRIPLKYIASFLCMRMETLSRIRSKLNM
ncbi:Crp/Fnr family transcriptional regulator [Pedobacter sandarakinus]|uniref:Crp/Fnr family transcriptional regulator n=1 Tax=Pedobacter sandarakinus TaxID=353156 RepID=UPI002246972C|nr:cyclic nucleotide-binding domain-containing protein [Pedobacter sandarakinus]MCX2575167.1 cyclic nucleotide-binding domain-containing protein [Pedobacter sandarakinus]